MRLTWLWMWAAQPQVTSTLALLHRQHCGKPQWDNHCDSLASSSHSPVVLWPPSSFYFISQGTFHLGLTENRFIHCFTSEKRKPHNARIPLCTCINTHDCAKTSESWSFLPTNLWPQQGQFTPQLEANVWVRECIFCPLSYLHFSTRLHRCSRAQLLVLKYIKNDPSVDGMILASC